MSWLRTHLLCSAACVLFVVSLARGSSAWPSPLLGHDIRLDVLEPQGGTLAAPPVVLYLVGLAAPRAGTEPDDAILRDLRSAGHLVVVCDYGSDARARWPNLNREILALREAVQKKRLIGERQIDAGRVYVVPAGHRLKRDVAFARDGERVLAMDVIYPSKPKTPAGALIEFSCDNQNRMGNGSLLACSDTILDGAATEGFIVAMADHPVSPPYKGLDAMPSSAERIKAAVRTLRSEMTALGGNGRIVPFGFSRGSGMALMLVTTAGMTEFERSGEHPGVSSSVQGAVVLSGRFTYVDLRPNDPMLARYVKAWGDRATAEPVWRRHGALDYLSRATIPLFLSINPTESPDALHQMEVLRRRLKELGSEFEYVPDPESRGHKVPLHPAVLEPLLRYTRDRLIIRSSAGPT